MTHHPRGDVQGNQDEAAFIRFKFEPTGRATARLATSALANSRKQRSAEARRRETPTKLRGGGCDEKHKRRLILSRKDKDNGGELD